MDKKHIITIGGLLIVICFFLPYFKACEIQVTGLQWATDDEIGDPLIWIILISGIVILLGSFVWKNATKAIALISSIAGLCLLLVKFIIPFAKKELQEIGLSVEVGGYGTIIGYILAIVGGASKDKVENDNNLPADKGGADAG